MVDRRGIVKIALRVDGRRSSHFNRGHRQGRVVVGNCEALLTVEPPREPTHLWMPALPVGIEIQLTNQITCIHRCDPRYQGTIAATVQAVASVARSLRTGVAPRQSDQFTRCIEWIVDWSGAARCKRRGKRCDRQTKAEMHRVAGTKRMVARFPLEWGQRSIVTGFGREPWRSWH